MLGWISLLLCAPGFLALSLAMPRHHEDLLGKKPSRSRQRLLRLLAVILLALSVVAALRAWPNLAIGLSAWLGIATVAAFAVAMLISRLSGQRHPKRAA